MLSRKSNSLRSKLHTPQQCSAGELAERDEELQAARNDYCFGTERVANPLNRANMWPTRMLRVPMYCINPLPPKELTGYTTMSLLILTGRYMKLRSFDVVTAAVKTTKDTLFRWLPTFIGNRRQPTPVEYASEGFANYPELRQRVPFNGETLTDENFAYQHLNGAMPYFIECVVGRLPPTCKITDADVAHLLPKNVNLQSLIDAQKLFIIDLSWLLAGITCSDRRAELIADGIRFAPTALFFIDESCGKLMPLAIQQLPAGARPYDRDEPNPVLVPRDRRRSRPDWTLAKLIVNHAVAIAHTAGLHYCGSVWSNVACVALRRNLSSKHPISNFLDPFVQQNLGHTVFFAYATKFDKTSDHYKPLTWTYFEKVFDFMQYHERNDIARRGVEGIPNYYWRDDTLRLWKCFEDHATRVVNATYADDTAVQVDHELQNFARSLSDPDEANLRGVPGNGRFDTRRQLIDVITTFAYLNSAKHTYDTIAHPWFVWPLATPLRLQIYPLTERDSATEADVIAALPSPYHKLQAHERVGVMAAVATFDRALLFHPATKRRVPAMPEWLDDGKFCDPTTNRAFVSDWYASLEAVEEAINARNKHLAARGLPAFDFLLPSRQSTALWY